MTRPTVSELPPAANGDTMRTGLAGQSCAAAGAQSASNAPSDAAINPVRFITGTSGLRDLAGVDLEDFVETPARDLAAGRKPDAVGLLHVLDDRAHSPRAAGAARN